MLSNKLTQIKQWRHEEQIEYFSIADPIEMQHLLHDVIKVLLYGYVTDISYDLNAEAKPQFLDDAIQNKTPKIIKENITTIK